MTNHPNRQKGYSRSATHWRSTTDGLGRTINYIVSDEPTVIAIAICSIHDPGGNRPSFRRIGGSDKVMGEADEPIPSNGLVVFGRSKFDRPTLSEVEAMTDIRGDVATASVRAAEKI